MSTSENWLDAKAREWAPLFASCVSCEAFDANAARHLPSRAKIIAILKDLISLLTPGCMPRESGNPPPSPADVAHELHAAVLAVSKYLCPKDTCDASGDCERAAKNAVEALFDGGPQLRELLRADVQAAYEGDPAATSNLEIVMCYPGFLAIASQRIAHCLYAAKIPLIPRVMTEYAHSRTGIDIHPGATIGPGFFIDHGTGVVIGETCVIGRNVKLYQGVTLGALSFAKDENGALIKGVKRHPNVEDNVIIYAGATILGGETVIGHGSVIGGNVWLTHSVPPFSKVYNAQPEPHVKLRVES
ncbi:MAG: serine acetyltransferase [Kiritimatiellaeota bacterium]|nr:serine acetyltransferase [Kiritimatiellota bacterium]